MQPATTPLHAMCQTRIGLGCWLSKPFLQAHSASMQLSPQLHLCFPDISFFPYLHVIGTFQIFHKRPAFYFPVSDRASVFFIYWMTRILATIKNETLIQLFVLIQIRKFDMVIKGTYNMSHFRLFAYSLDSKDLRFRSSPWRLVSCPDWIVTFIDANRRKGVCVWLPWIARWDRQSKENWVFGFLLGTGKLKGN